MKNWVKSEFLALMIFDHDWICYKFDAGTLNFRKNLSKMDSLETRVD